MTSSNPPASDDHSSQKKTSTGDNKPLQVIVFDPLNHDPFFESEEYLNKTYTSFPVHLLRWRNRIDIYLDEEHKTGFITSIDLSQIGFGKNWKRRLGYDYTILHIKGIKPAMPASAEMDSAAAMKST